MLQIWTNKNNSSFSNMNEATQCTKARPRQHFKPMYITTPPGQDVARRLWTFKRCQSCVHYMFISTRQNICAPSQTRVLSNKSFMYKHSSLMCNDNK
jgi:hypothetical protein